MFLKKNCKKNKQFPLDQQNIRPPRDLAQLPIFKKMDWIFSADIQQNSLPFESNKTKQIKTFKFIS